MSAPLTTEFAFGEADPSVLTVYFLALGFWTAAAGNDFISSTWRSVRETRQKGKAHVVFVSIPMIYICVYVYFQHKNKDYKEMGAALLALLFALLHLARTFMGLWQLHMFKQWTISTIKSMESLGCKTRIPGEANVRNAESDSDDDDGDDDDDNTKLPSFLERTSLTIFPEEEDRIKKLADDILVNDMLIDNRLSDVNTVCKFCLFSRQDNRNMKKAKSKIYRCWLWFRYGFANALRGVLILLSLTFQKSPHFLMADSAPRLVPKRPESIWVHWATALVAQTDWVLDFPQLIPNQVAERILLSAAMHTHRTRNAGNSNNVVRAQNNSSTSAYLGYEEWHKYPKLCKGHFSKQEFLKRACKTGNGLPYQARHSKAVEVKSGVRQYGYSSFDSELLRAREALPPDIESRVKNFNVEILEWFTISVSIEISMPSQEMLENMESDTVSSTNVSPSTTHSESPNGDRDPLHTRDMCIQNLKAQIGCEKQSDLTLDHLKLPALRGTFATLWGNRNILEVSCHIDNWVSLYTGEAISELLQKNANFKQKWVVERALGPSLSSAGGHSILSKIIQESRNLEKDIFLSYRVVRPERSFPLLDVSVTFLGCSMEMLRSSLATWAEKNEGDEEMSWKPSLFPTDAVSEGVKSKILEPFDASADFSSCLQSLRSFPDMSKQFVKMRVLWELQNHFHTYLPAEGVAPSRGEAIALCILSFPAVSVDAVRMERKEECVVDLEVGDEELVRVDDYGYIVRASLGPQDLQLSVSFKGREDNSKVEISIRICEMEAGGISHFDWEVWRDAFYGRLEGRRQFQENFNIRQFSFIPPVYPITSGIEKIDGSKNAVIPQNEWGADMSVWKGWVPHCSTICTFELTTGRFILRPGTYEGSYFPYPITDRLTLKYSLPRRVWVPVAYAKANAVWLRNASLAADDLLQSAFGSHGQRNAQSALERAEMLLTENSDGDPGLALELIQVSAVHERDFTSLEKAINILLRHGRGQGAVELLECFYGYRKNGRGDPEKNLPHVFSFLRNELCVEKVILLFKEILKATKLDILRAGADSFSLSLIYGTAVESYQMFLLMSIFYRGAVVRTVELLDQSIDESEVEKSTICYAFLLEKGREGVQRDLPRAIELYGRGIARRDPYAMYNRAVLLFKGEEGAEQDLPRAMELFDKLINVFADVNAMIKLADFLVEGGKGFSKNVPRAVELYTRAVDEDKDGSIEAMEKLAGVLSIGGDGIQKDVQQAVSLYNRAIREGGSRSAIIALANILQTGSEGVPADPEQDATLYRNSSV